MKGLLGLRIAGQNSFYFATKGRDLVEMVERLCDAGYCPVIDKNTRTVIGCRGGHRNIRAELYRYHTVLKSDQRWFSFSTEEQSLHADNYSLEGFGYHFSSMGETYGGTRSPIVFEAYRPDRFDRELFKFYDK